jgi:putative transposase
MSRHTVQARKLLGSEPRQAPAHLSISEGLLRRSYRDLKSLLHQEQTMKSKRFTEERIIAVLKESEAGAKTKELCRRHGISEATFYNWKAKYAGMTVSEARRLRELEAENSKLKRLLADAELEKAALKDLLGRKW